MKPTTVCIQSLLDANLVMKVNPWVHCPFFHLCMYDTLCDIDIDCNTAIHILQAILEQYQHVLDFHEKTTTFSGTFEEFLFDSNLLFTEYFGPIRIAT